MGVPRPKGRTRVAEVGAAVERGASVASPEKGSSSRARGERSEPREREYNGARSTKRRLLIGAKGEATVGARTLALIRSQSR